MILPSLSRAIGRIKHQIFDVCTAPWLQGCSSEGKAKGSLLQERVASLAKRSLEGALERPLCTDRRRRLKLRGIKKFGSWQVTRVRFITHFGPDALLIQESYNRKLDKCDLAHSATGARSARRKDRCVPGPSYLPFSASVMFFHCSETALDRVPRSAPGAALLAAGKVSFINSA